MEDAPGLKHDDKKDVAWDAAAGKQPLENQRNSSRLGSAAPLRTGYSYGSKVSSMSTTWSDLQMRRGISNTRDLC